MSERIPDIYANWVRVSMSMFDITLEFGLRTPQEEEAQKKGRVRMSPQHARSLLILLQRYLDEYGDTFQEIRLPQEYENALAGEEQVGEDNEIPSQENGDEL